jgi:tRNA(Ser,Leu) C12 N-acetylase TAN1
MDLLVSYSWNHFFPARREIVSVLKNFGDPDPKVEKSGVMGIALVHTSLDNREVIRKCKELFVAGPAFEFAIKWVPVDFWCDTALDSMKKVIEEIPTPSISVPHSARVSTTGMGEATNSIRERPSRTVRSVSFHASASHGSSGTAKIGRHARWSLN